MMVQITVHQAVGKKHKNNNNGIHFPSRCVSLVRVNIHSINLDCIIYLYNKKKQRQYYLDFSNNFCAIYLCFSLST